MKRYKIETLASANDEIENIIDYIALDSIVNTLNWYDNIKEKIRSLETMPERCPNTSCERCWARA